MNDQGTDRDDRALRDLAGHFRLALQAGGLGTWRWDMATGVTTWDERLEELFGVAPGGFDGSYEMYVSLLHPDDRESVATKVQHAIEARGTYRVEHRVIWPDGTVHWITGAGGVTVDTDGAVTGTIGCCLDVTERVIEQLERERLTIAAVDTAAQERVQRQRLEFLTAIHDVLNAAGDRTDLMVKLTEAAVPRLGDWCAIHLLPDPDAADVHRATPLVEITHVDPSMVAFAKGLQERFPYDPQAPTGVPHVIRTGETEFYPDITPGVIDALDLDDEARAIIDQLALRSAITVPLIKRDRVFGAMQFVMSNSSRRYTDDDVALAQAVAGRIASSLENRRLNAHQRLIADTLQRSLLPASLPDVPGLDVAVRYCAAGEGTAVGGDFFDLFAVDDHRWAVVIGDVCGTGPEAASLTGLARHTIRDSTWHGDGPVDVLVSLNRAILRADTGSFCTTAYAVISEAPQGFDVTLVCGGHPLPILVTGTGATTVGHPGTLMGVFPSTTCQEDTLSLASGDTLVLYTDGATDLPAPHGRTESEFAALVGAVATGATDAETIVDSLQVALEKVLAFDQRDDDLALLVIHVR